MEDNATRFVVVQLAKLDEYDLSGTLRIILHRDDAKTFSAQPGIACETSDIVLRGTAIVLPCARRKATDL